MSRLCSLCKEVGKIQLYSSTSTAWIGKHLMKRHNLSKPTTTESHLSLAPHIESTTPVVKGALDFDWGVRKYVGTQYLFIVIITFFKIIK